jgi:hypothetical protein
VSDGGVNKFDLGIGMLDVLFLGLRRCLDTFLSRLSQGFYGNKEIEKVWNQVGWGMQQVV